VLLLDVIPLSMGIATAGGVMAVIIPRNTTVPVSHKKTFTTARDNQEFVDIRVYEGERTQVTDNNLLGQFRLEGIPRAPRAVPQIDVSFDVDANGILSVKAVDQKTKKEAKITISGDRARLSKEEVEKMVIEAEKFQQVDQENAEIQDWKNSLENKAYNAKSMAQEGKVAEQLSPEDKQKLFAAADSALQWLEANPGKSMGLDGVKGRMKELEAIINPVLTAAYAKLGHETAPSEEEDQHAHQPDMGTPD